MALAIGQVRLSRKLPNGGFRVLRCQLVGSLPTAQNNLQPALPPPRQSPCGELITRPPNPQATPPNPACMYRVSVPSPALISFLSLCLYLDYGDHHQHSSPFLSLCHYLLLLESARFPSSSTTNLGSLTSSVALLLGSNCWPMPILG